MKAGDTLLLSGGTGTIGARLVPALLDAGYGVRALSRSASSARRKLGSEVEICEWDGCHVTPDQVADCRAVVHLAGEPIFGGRLTRSRRESTYESRVASTRSVVTAMEGVEASRRPEILLCASAVGFYDSSPENELAEDATPGTGFLADLCRDWEREAKRADDLGLRRISLRIGVVLSKDGGALPSLLRLFRLGLGGRLGNGKQWFPWVHVDDVVRMIAAALADDRWRGPVNATAPNPVRNAEFTRVLAATVRRPAFFHVPAFVLRTALGELSGELLGSRRVVPRAASAQGFAFHYPDLAEALAAER